jgi:hypothetical protein
MGKKNESDRSESGIRSDMGWLLGLEQSCLLLGYFCFLLLSLVMVSAVTASESFGAVCLPVSSSKELGQG